MRGCLAIIYSTTKISVYYEVIERNGFQLVHATVVLLTFLDSAATDYVATNLSAWLQWTDEH